MSKVKRRILGLVTALVLVFGVAVSGAGATSNRDQVFGTIRSVFEIVETYHKNGADLDKFFKGAVAGGLEALGDPYTNYFSPPDFADFLNSLNGNVTGIGVYLDIEGNYVIVAAPIKGTPAFKAGLQTGDRILEANGIPLVGATIEKAGSIIRGEPGTEVVLKIERPAEGRTFEVTIVRALIHVPQVEYELLENGVGHLILNSFGGSASQEFFSAVKDLKEQGATSLVLDLRQNPGGYVSDAVSIASAWVPKGEPVMYELGKDEEVAQRSQGTLINLPTVVLVDGGSASAAEILAGAIQDYKAGTLVGTKTFGKGTVQQLLFMQNGDGMKVTIAEYFTGKRRKVDGVGLTPDYVVEAIQHDEALAKPYTLNRVLAPNRVGMDVLDLQYRLRFLGYEPETEGTYGGKTLQAVYQFRSKHRLPALPTVDSGFVKMLNQAVAEKLRQKDDVQLKKAIELLTQN
ncbi:MAG: S41 family peptidase [Bacillota bacterium]